MFYLTDGSGFQINLIGTPGNSSKLAQLVNKYLPTAKIVGKSNSGTITIGISKNSAASIANFLTSIASNTNLVKEWGISDSTMEEVFLKIIKDQKLLNQVNVNLEKKHIKVVSSSNCFSLYASLYIIEFFLFKVSY
jgi:hypothetical protein